ncbi:MAG: hypothetical protein K0S06_3505 [Microvirga sp.]|jgi:Flp pilus assembly protein TadG|nr:hypothetical protein [Microvirga sp.]
MVSFPHDRSGNVLTVFGLSLPIILAAAGAALDYSDLTRKRSELQKLADETALASTKALATSTAVSPSQRENDARKLAERLLKDAAGTQRTITPSAAENTVRIDLAHEHPLRFGAFVGARSSSLAVQSEATYSIPASACVLAVGQAEDAGISLVGSAKITAPQCGVWSDAPGPTSMARHASSRAPFAAWARPRLRAPRLQRAAATRFLILTKLVPCAAESTRPPHVRFTPPRAAVRATRAEVARDPTPIRARATTRT